MKQRVLMSMGLGLLAFVLVSSPVLAQNLIENGSFETPVVTPDDWPGYLEGDEVPGWTRVGDMGGLNNNQGGNEPTPFLGAGRPIPDGNQVYFVQQNIDESDNIGVSLQQEISGMEDGRYYQLSFYVGIRPNNEGMDMEVTFGDTVLMPEERFTNNTGPLEFIEIMFQYDSDAMGAPVLSFNSAREDAPEDDNTILYDDVRLELLSLGASIGGPSFAALGDDVVLRATATDTIGEVSYQWYFNGVELEGETGSTLELPSVDYDDAGVYSVEISDDADSSTVAFTLVVVESLPVSTSLMLGLVAIMLLGLGAVALRKVRA